MNYQHEPHGLFLVVDNKSFFASVECTVRGLDPLTTPLVVLREVPHTAHGLVVAASPMAKKMFHLHNRGTKSQLPRDDRLIIVPPRMELYERRNQQINELFLKFVSKQELLPYSIDESILDVSHRWQKYGPSVDSIVKAIRREIYQQLGLITTVGIGDNPLLAKLALDLVAKEQPDFVGRLQYRDIPTKLWPVHPLTDIWGIGRQTASKLNSLGIHTLGDLAHTDPHALQAVMGKVRGTSLYATAWGIDRSHLDDPRPHRSHSISNSHVITEGSSNEHELRQTLEAVGQNAFRRVQKQGLVPGNISVSLTFQDNPEDFHGHSVSKTRNFTGIPDQQSALATAVRLFNQLWHGEDVRIVFVGFGNLQRLTSEQLDLFSAKE